MIVCYVCGALQPPEKLEERRCADRDGCLGRALRPLSRPLLKHATVVRRAEGRKVRKDET